MVLGFGRIAPSSRFLTECRKMRQNWGVFVVWVCCVSALLVFVLLSSISVARWVKLLAAAVAL